MLKINLEFLLRKTLVSLDLKIDLGSLHINPEPRNECTKIGGSTRSVVSPTIKGQQIEDQDKMGGGVRPDGVVLPPKFNTFQVLAI